jgi:hypothetical protein
MSQVLTLISGVVLGIKADILAGEIKANENSGAVLEVASLPWWTKRPQQSLSFQVTFAK